METITHYLVQILLGLVLSLLFAMLIDLVYEWTLVLPLCTLVQIILSLWVNFPIIEYSLFIGVVFSVYYFRCRRHRKRYYHEGLDMRIYFVSLQHENRKSHQ